MTVVNRNENDVDFQNENINIEIKMMSYKTYVNDNVFNENEKNNMNDYYHEN